MSAGSRPFSQLRSDLRGRTPRHADGDDYVNGGSTSDPTGIRTHACILVWLDD